MIHECLCPGCTEECDMDVPFCPNCRDYGCTEVDNNHA